LSKADIETIIQEQVADLATGNSYLPLDLPQIINQEPGLLTFDLTLPPGEHKYYLATRDNQ